MKKGTIVRRVQGPKKYGILPQKALEADWVVLATESKHDEFWYRCNTISNLSLVGEKDEWGKVRTIRTDSTIFLPEELADTGRVYPL